MWACGTLACLSGDVAAGVAMMVAYDCWLRISEISGITAADVHDTRGQVDVVGRGVSVFLPETKTGRRQAGMREDPAFAALLLVLAGAQRQRAAKLFTPKSNPLCGVEPTTALFLVQSADTKNIQKSTGNCISFIFQSAQKR